MVDIINREALQAILAADDAVVLVEALPEKYYRDAHLPGAINIPHDEIDRQAPSVLPDKTAPIVVYCASGPCKNSGIAAERLEALGYTNVSDYHEGKQDWQDAGLPVVSGSAPGRRAA